MGRYDYFYKLKLPVLLQLERILQNYNFITRRVSWMEREGADFLGNRRFRPFAFVIPVIIFGHRRDT